MIKEIREVLKDYMEPDIDRRKAEYIAKTLWKDIVLNLGTSFPDHKTHQWFQIHSIKVSPDNKSLILSFSHQFLATQIDGQEEMVEFVENQFKFSKSSTVNLVNQLCLMENHIVLTCEIYFSIQKNMLPISKKIKYSLERTREYLMRHGRTDKPLIVE